jgi:hypothetical protein
MSKVVLVKCWCELCETEYVREYPAATAPSSYFDNNGRFLSWCDRCWDLRLTQYGDEE